MDELGCGLDALSSLLGSFNDRSSVDEKPNEVAGSSGHLAAVPEVTQLLLAEVCATRELTCKLDPSCTGSGETTKSTTQSPRSPSPRPPADGPASSHVYRVLGLLVQHMHRLIRCDNTGPVTEVSSSAAQLDFMAKQYLSVLEFAHRASAAGQDTSTTSVKLLRHLCRGCANSHFWMRHVGVRFTAFTEVVLAGLQSEFSYLLDNNRGRAVTWDTGVVNDNDEEDDRMTMLRHLVETVLDADGNGMVDVVEFTLLCSVTYSSIHDVVDALLLPSDDLFRFDHVGPRPSVVDCQQRDASLRRVISLAAGKELSLVQRACRGQARRSRSASSHRPSSKRQSPLSKSLTAIETRCMKSNCVADRSQKHRLEQMNRKLQLELDAANKASKIAVTERYAMNKVFLKLKTWCGSGNDPSTKSNVDHRHTPSRGRVVNSALRESSVGNRPVDRCAQSRRLGSESATARRSDVHSKPATKLSPPRPVAAAPQQKQQRLNPGDLDNCFERVQQLTVSAKARHIPSDRRDASSHVKGHFMRHNSAGRRGMNQPRSTHSGGARATRNMNYVDADENWQCDSRFIQYVAERERVYGPAEVGHRPPAVGHRPPPRILEEVEVSTEIGFTEQYAEQQQQHMKYPYMASLVGGGGL